MPRFAANLTMLWPELDVYDRLRAAADAGFRRVEILFVHQLDQERLVRLLDELGLELVLFDPAPGNWDAGERGLLSLPGREDEFLATVGAAVESARRFGARRLNALAGVLPVDVPREVAFRTATANLRAAARVAAPAGVRVLVEPINTTDFPGYFVPTVEQGAELIRAADDPDVRLQFDQYHVGMMGGDALALVREYLPLVEHVQIADVPGRHQPGTGTQPIREFLADLDGLGYGGAVGLEYRPQGSTEDALRWLPREARG